MRKITQPAFAASVFAEGRIERCTKRFFLANGVIDPFILLVQVVPPMIAVGALWLVTFNLSAVLVTLVFRSKKVGVKNREVN